MTEGFNYEEKRKVLKNLNYSSFFPEEIFLPPCTTVLPPSDLALPLAALVFSLSLASALGSDFFGADLLRSVFFGSTFLS